VSLAGRSALVTGGARGIGRAIAERLAADGADVVIGDLSIDDRTTAAVDALERRGHRAVAIRADISRPADVRDLFAATLARCGKIDIVIANAGIELVDVPFTDYTDEQIERVLDVNARGTFLTLRETALTIAEGGRIIVVSSNTTRLTMPGFALYGASKLAGTYLVGVLAKELAPRGVTVNAVVPGATLGAGVFTERSTDEPGIAGLIERTPLGRLATPSNVADAVAFLVGDGAGFITGHQLVVDGGASI
jgi:3-oxoacyl-[acyl-carrier protein] reductase